MKRTKTTPVKRPPPLRVALYVCAGCFKPGGTMVKRGEMYTHPECSVNWIEVGRRRAMQEAAQHAGGDAT